MAMIGLRYVVAAQIDAETPGAAITYKAGKVIGKAISANLTWNRNNNPLYADDTIAEDDNGVTSGSIELNVDDLSDEARGYVLGEKTVTVGQGTEYETSEEAAPYVGFGYIRVRRKNGATTYQACWYHKAQFGEGSENAQTKGENIEWQTPTITGRIMGVQNDESLAINFRRRANFDTEAAAQAWLKTKAGIA